MEINKLTMEIFSKLEQQWLSTTQTAKTTTAADTKKSKILSIDGGGISTLTAGAFLIHLEESIQLKTGDNTARITDFFDIISGTGIGALLALVINVADINTGRPLFTAREAVAFLTSNSHKLFKPNKRGLFGRKSSSFSSDSMSRVVKTLFKNMTLKHTCKPILIPCYDVSSSAPFVFSRAAASASGWMSHDFELWKVCCAATATPFVFKPFNISSVDGKTNCVAVDGGLVMNNPAAVAVTHVLHNKVDFPLVNGIEDLIVLSLGNGALSCGGSGGGENWSGGSRKIGMFAFGVAADGVSETVDQMLGNAFSSNRQDYVRIQANGLEGLGLMTTEKVLKERGIESLTFGGKRLLPETNGDRIEAFAQRLVNASSKNSLPPSPYKSLSPLLDGR